MRAVAGVVEEGATFFRRREVCKVADGSGIKWKDKRGRKVELVV